MIELVRDNRIYPQLPIKGNARGTSTEASRHDLHAENGTLECGANMELTSGTLLLCSNAIKTLLCFKRETIGTPEFIKTT